MGFKCYWEELNFNGAFFRAAGTGALLFNGGLQGESLNSSSVSASGYFWCPEYGAGGVFRQTEELTVHKKADGGHNMNIYFKKTYMNLSGAFGSGTETRPKNYTIKIWKRLS